MRLYLLAPLLPHYSQSSRGGRGSPPPKGDKSMTYNVTRGAERSAPTLVVRTKAANVDLRNTPTTENMAHVKTLLAEVNNPREVNLD